MDTIAAGSDESLSMLLAPPCSASIQRRRLHRRGHEAGLGTPHWQNLKTVELGVTMFRWLRRAYQIVFLGFFLFLVLVTTAGLIRGYDVQCCSSSTSGRAHHCAGFAFAAPHVAVGADLIVLTLVLGRVFCAWMCPMGVLHQALGFLARKRRPPTG